MRRAKFWFAFDVVFAVMNACFVAVGNDSIIMCCNAVVAIILSLQAIWAWRDLKRGGES